MVFKGKMKELIVLGVLVIIVSILIFYPEEAAEDMSRPVGESIAIDSDEFPEEDLQYLTRYAWHTDQGNERYWLLISLKEQSEEDESYFALTYTEYMDAEITGNDFSLRFTETVYYEDINMGNGIITIDGKNGKAVEGRYTIDPQGNVLTIYPLTEDGKEAVIYHGTSFDNLVYPTF